MLKYTVGLIGLGNIGMGYDYDIPNSESIFTHANAFSLHSNFELVGGCDPDINKRKRFEKRYSQTFSSVSQLIQAENPEIFVVSSPTKTHDQVIKEIIEIGQPKLILCEKPLTSSYKKSKLINNLCKASKVPIILNFPRRAEIGIKKIKQMILSEKLIPPFKVNVFYSKGFLNSSSHYLYELIKKFGNLRVNKIKLFEKNYYKKFINYSFFSIIGKIPTVFQGLKYSINDNDYLELSIHCKKSLYEIKSSGVVKKKYSSKRGNFYDKFIALNHFEDYKKISIVNGLSNGYKHIINLIKKNKKYSFKNIQISLEILKINDKLKKL